MTFDRTLTTASGTSAAAHRERWWGVAAVGVVLLLSLLLRLSTRMHVDEPRFDEQWIRAPIETILRDGWSVRTAIDFEETKGPGLIWPYALLGEATGPGLPALRWITVGFFVLGAVPLTALARRAGVRGSGLVVVALLYTLVPQQAVLGQLLMSEALFTTVSLATLWAFWAGFSRAGQASTTGAARLRAAFPMVILVAFLMSFLLHTRIHAVALAAAICVVAWERDGRRSWPWWAACALAGLSRLPLAVRWGGLVSPMYREMHQLGDGIVQWSNASYLLAALVPLTGVFLFRARVARGAATRWRAPMAGALVGLGLGLLAPPLTAERLPAPPLWAERAPNGIPRYLGPVASVGRVVERRVDAATGSSSAVEGGTPRAGSLASRAAVALLAAIGGASLAALAALSWRRGRANCAPWEDERLLGRLTTWTLVVGIALYTLTQSFVLDRYLAPWAMLLPVLWFRWLPRVVLLGLGLVLAAASVAWSIEWLG